VDLDPVIRISGNLPPASAIEELICRYICQVARHRAAGRSARWRTRWRAPTPLRVWPP